MRLKYDPLGIWCVARGSRGELHELEVALRVWARGCDSEGRGRALYRWERDGLHMLTGAVLASPPLLRNHPPPRAHDRQTKELVSAVSALVSEELLRPYQADAVVAALSASGGRSMLDMVMGSGKTRVAAAIAALGGWAGRPRWVYLVSNHELVEQAGESFRTVLPEMRRALGGVECSIRGMTYAGIAGLAAREEWDGVLVDECHALPAPTRAVPYAAIRARLRVGMSGTPLDRQDINNALTIGLLGPVVYRVSAPELEAQGHLARGTVRFIRYEH